MKRVTIALVVASIYVIVYHASPMVGLPEAFTATLFALSPFCMIYVVYMVLRFGEPSRHTFDQRFYDDWDYTRNGKEEMNGRSD